jgi:RNA polymerase sigma-70 factor (ECF subfamily)
MQKNDHTAEQQVETAHLKNSDGQDRQQLQDDQKSLAARLRRGDRTAAVDLVDQYYNRIYVFMRVVGHDRQVSEDLTQEAFLQAWYHIGQLRDNKALNSWLYRIAGNVSRLYWRRHKARIEATSIDEMDLPAPAESLLHRVEGLEQLARLRGAVAELPWKLKQAVVLHYMESLTIAEAAEAAGVRQGTFKSRLNRALSALRRNMV